MRRSVRFMKKDAHASDCFAIRGNDGRRLHGGSGSRRGEFDKLRHFLAASRQPVAAILGLTYKPGTSTLRRSTSVELCAWLQTQGVRVQAHDPAVQELPEEIRDIMVLCPSPEEALRGADVAVVATEWPAYRSLAGSQFAAAMRRPQVIDQNHFLANVLAADARITYVATGRAAA